MHPLEQATFGTTWKKHNRVFLCSFKKFEITFDGTQWRKVKSVQPMSLCLLWSECFEETFENSHQRKDKQMQSVSICISPGRKFEEAFVKRWRKERRTLLHFFVVYDLQGGCFDLFRVEDSKIQTKKWKFQFKHFPVGYLCFPFFGRDFGIFKFFRLIKSINAQRNIREKYSE